MKKGLLIFVLSLLAVSTSFSVLVQAGESTAGGPTIYQEEDYWKEKYDELYEDYKKLEADFNTLYNTIMPQVEALRSNYDKIKADLDEVRTELETSRTDYSALNTKYKSAVRELNTRTTLMYAFIVTTVVFLATTLYLALRRKS